MGGYSARDVAKLLGLSVGQIRAYVRAGFLSPQRGDRGEYRFSFQDLVLLRAAKGLVEARIPLRRVRAALRKLKKQIPEERPLSGIQISAEGDRIIVRDGDNVWQPESGQTLFDFEVSELAKKVAPLARRAAEEARTLEKELRAEDWFALACDIEATNPKEARDAYRRALELDPASADARVNLGRLLHEAGELGAAEAHYRLALEVKSDDATAAFNLGVVLEDQERFDEAIHAYEVAIGADPRCSDAYFNLAHLCELIGRPAMALRYLKIYRKLTRG